MIVLLVILTFCFFIAIDWLINKSKARNASAEEKKNQEYQSNAVWNVMFRSH